MIRLIPVSPPCPAVDFAHIPLLELDQLPHGLPFDECLKQLKEPA